MNRSSARRLLLLLVATASTVACTAKTDEFDDPWFTPADGAVMIDDPTPAQRPPRPVPQAGPGGTDGGGVTPTDDAGAASDGISSDIAPDAIDTAPAVDGSIRPLPPGRPR